ncbi:MAG: hypothetical protein IPL49_22155 [Saprospirales bacterium]|nr:hypothetical protein [Saprospirales bacterium]
MSGSFLMEGRIIDFKGKDVLNHGFIWSTTQSSPTTLTFDQNEGKYEAGPVALTQSHPYIHVIPNLESDKTYFARAFAQNEFGYGYGIIQQVTTLVAPEPLVTIDTFYLVSDANGTGEPNPGEQVTFNITLKNEGELAAENVNLILSSGDVTVISNQPVDFGTLLPGSSKSKQIQLQVSNLVSAGDVVLINAEINSGSFQWTDNTTFTFTVAASPEPKVDIEAITLVADANGSGQPTR